MRHWPFIFLFLAASAFGYAPGPRFIPTDLNLAPGQHALSAMAHYPVANFSETSNSTFTVNGDSSVTNYYDGAGNVTNRVFGNGESQILKWDAEGRLVSVIVRTDASNGLNWSAIYDAFGRRLRTYQSNLVANTWNNPQTNDAYFDPQVKFERVGVGINGKRWWKVMGPDADGKFGSMQGIGGLEAVVRDDNSSWRIWPAIGDYFGNVPATLQSVTNHTTNITWYLYWSPARVGGYGPLPGYTTPPPPLTTDTNTPLTYALVWGGRPVDPTGFYCIGARYYDPVAGRFLSPDPAGFEGSQWDLYSYCNNDPINKTDPTGLLGKGM